MSSTDGSTIAPTPHQDRLISFCRAHGARPPLFQIVSDRRGGRTAWSCETIIAGKTFRARFWYDGHYVHNAREDAAQVALENLGVLPLPPQRQPQPSQHCWSPSNGWSA
ncbi:Hypothetical predicted protein [Lecanosticta acicola]|uniref:DRBM domain-containing protein n=1 Tax=Lecanosticta acicola TaxID=111012 RepID=A0AAI9EB34_9PEZI|nr:Hypothetical predicted protein [Lecanosticta acicola]